MTQEQPYEITEGDVAYAVAQTLNGFSTAWLTNADALLPNPETPGHPAVVVTAADGSRYGLEVVRIPEPHVLPETPLGEPVSEPTPGEVSMRQRQLEHTTWKHPRPEDAQTTERVTLTINYMGAPLLSGYLPLLALRARIGDGEIFPPFYYSDPIDPEDPDAPRSVRRARIVIEHLDARPTEEELRRRSGD